ncbi:hypothetical protein [Chromohalobacter canadensis]|uniref:hypothetical protein n=1 Tax=Chromohalobacter canadensis TaxID=141389 RepID=UPI00240F373C|nr:hypothetical protein [Chromohalobacter canadensis]
MALHVLVWGVVSGLSLMLSAGWLTSAVSLSGAALVGYWWHGQRRWELRERLDGEHATWQWREASGQWQNAAPIPLRIGACLIGLRLGRRIIWLWPDSAASISRRLLRIRLLEAMPSGRH